MMSSAPALSPEASLVPILSENHLWSASKHLSLLPLLSDILDDYDDSNCPLLYRGWEMFSETFMKHFAKHFCAQVRGGGTFCHSVELLPPEMPEVFILCLLVPAAHTSPEF